MCNNSSVPERQKIILCSPSPAHTRTRVHTRYAGICTALCFAGSYLCSSDT